VFCIPENDFMVKLFDFDPAAQLTVHASGLLE